MEPLPISEAIDLPRKKYGEYQEANKLYKTKNGELLLVSKNDEFNENKLYILNKIEIINNERKIKIEKEINILKEIDSKYIMPIIEHFTINEQNKEYYCIILNNYESNLSKIIYETNFLNSRNIWKFFIQIIFALNPLNAKKFLSENINLSPEIIYIDEKNNIKIGGIGISLDIENRKKSELDILSYNSPEIIKGENNDEKNIMWTAGCILFELAFKKRVFDNKNYKALEHSILRLEYELPYDCEKEFNLIISKLLCVKKNRLSITDLISEGNFKYKIIELNLFNEILKTNLQGK